MKIIKNEKSENSKIDIQMFFDSTEFDAAIDGVYRKNINKYNVNGFRRGHVPRRVIEKMYGADVFYEDAIDALLDAQYPAAIYELGYIPFTRPDVSVDKIENKELTLNISFFVKPEFELCDKDYKGIEIEKPDTTVTEDDIENKINTERTNAARELSVSDRPAQLNDITDIDFEGFMDGVAFDGGAGKNYKLTLGAGQFIAGFDDQIIGKNVGDSFDVNVTFPEKYFAAELAGKPAVFKVTLNALYTSEIPEFNDDFVKEVSTFDTVDEYKESVKSKLEEEHNHAAEHQVEDAINDKLIALCTAVIPEYTIDREVESEIERLKYRLESQNMTIENIGMDMETLKKELRPRSENQVKLRLVIEKIIELEKLACTNEETEAKIAEIAAHYNMEVEKIKTLISADEINEELLSDKAYNIVKDSVVYIEKPATDTPAGE